MSREVAGNSAEAARTTWENAARKPALSGVLLTQFKRIPGLFSSAEIGFAFGPLEEGRVDSKGLVGFALRNFRIFFSRFQAEITNPAPPRPESAQPLIPSDLLASFCKVLDGGGRVICPPDSNSEPSKLD
ncbi:MAG TPA: hypothetical protein VGZ29_08260 [Terriglobia bacterium]|nr:hypothetical protein [Terriglobia bacterium]